MPVIVPVVVAILSHFVARLPVFGPLFAKGICIAASFFTLYSMTSLIMASPSDPIRVQLLEMPTTTGTTPILLYVDYLALLPAFLTSLLGTLAILYNIYYMSPFNKAYNVGWEFNRSYSFILLFIGAMIGTVFSGDLLSLLIFLELISICSYALISFWQKEESSLNAAMKCIVLTHIGSLALLVATIIIFSIGGTLTISDIGQRIPIWHPLLPLVFALLLVAALPKSVQFPLHTWLPDGTIAPTSATVLFHVCGFQSGIYMIARFFNHCFHSNLVYVEEFAFPTFFGFVGGLSFMISLIGATTMIVGVLNGLLESDFKRIIAYSTISGLGFVVIGIGLATPLTVAAGLFLMFAHALCYGLMFLIAGAVLYSTGKHNINDLGGLYRSMPITTVFCTIGCLALAAFPLFADFLGKYLLFQGALESGSVFFLIVSFLGCILNAAVAARILHSVFMGRLVLDKDSSPRDPRPLMLLPMLLLSSALIIFGILPSIPLNFLVLPAVRQLGYQIRLVEDINYLITSTGFYDPITIALPILGFFFAIALISSLVRIHSAKKGSVFEEALQPFLSGEDIVFQKSVHAFHLYPALRQVLKIDDVCHLLNVDRVYYCLSESFSALCSSLLRYDIRQQYLYSVLLFVCGAFVVVLVALLAV